MAKLYTKGSTVVDEILAGSERYNILEDGGGAFKAAMQINLATAVTQAGTVINAARLNNIENGVDALDTLLDAVNTSNATKAALAGQLGGTVASPDVRGLRETSGPTLLTLGAIADGQALVRSGTTLIGSTIPGLGGWVAASGTWSYASADSPTYVINTTVDMTPYISVGYRIRLIQTTTKYFIVVAITSTTITLYGGTDFTLVSAAITGTYWSNVKAPIGFDVNPEKWTVLVADTTNAAIATPAATTWLNPGSLSIVVPIGRWNVSYWAVNDLTVNVAAVMIFALRCTLSTTNNSESNSALTSSFGGTFPIFASALARFMQSRSNYTLTLAAKTTYYLNCYWGSGTALSINFRGDLSPTRIQLVCAYL